jgi:hypothetical protein
MVQVLLRRLIADTQKLAHEYEPMTGIEPRMKKTTQPVSNKNERVAALTPEETSNRAAQASSR